MATTRKTHNGSAPELGPPDAAALAGSTGGSTATLTAPTRLEPADVSLVTTTAPDTAGPTLQPPHRETAATAVAGAKTGTAAAGVAAAIWQYGKTVSATWSINETRNAWVLVDGVGWRKIFNGTDGAFTALTTLAGQARQTGHQISFREDGGMIYEIYLW